MDSMIRINSQTIDCLTEHDEVFVAIKPICDALGIQFQAQYNKLKDDDDLRSTVSLRDIVAGDGKVRQMVCLPLKYIFGWLFSISPNNVSADAKESVRRYRKECYDALYNHFYASARRQLELTRQEVVLLESIDAAKDHKAAANAELKELEERLMNLRKARLDTDPTLF